MNQHEEIRTASAPRPPYQFSQGVQKGPLVQVAGQGGVDHAYPIGSAENDLSAQTVRALDHVRGILEAGGSSFDDAVMVRVYLATRDDFAEMCTIYDRYMRRFVSGVFPARTTVIVTLPIEGMLVEVDALAVRS